MRGIPLKRIAIVLAMLLAFGALRLPLERRITGQLRAQQFLDDNVNVPMLEELGQSGFAAALGGFRSLVASYYYIVAHVNAFDKEDWAKVDQQYGLITTLQPRSAHYWDQYVWHIGWNAYGWALREADYQAHLGNDWKASNLKNITAPGYLARAEEVALKGARLVRDDFRFYQRIGTLYEDKFDDVCEGARWYQKGSLIEGAPRYMRNIFAILLAQCEGAEDEAYPLIRERYLNPDPTRRALSVDIQMASLEERLARRELAQKGVDEVRRLAGSEPENYLHRVALALYYAEVEGSPEKAMGVYEEMLRPGAVEVPAFYKAKWAMIAAAFPEREALAYRSLRDWLIKTQRRLTSEEAAVVRELEQRLEIPRGRRLFPAPEKSPSPPPDK